MSKQPSPISHDKLPAEFIGNFDQAVRRNDKKKVMEYVYEATKNDTIGELLSHSVSTFFNKDTSSIVGIDEFRRYILDVCQTPMLIDEFLRKNILSLFCFYSAQNKIDVFLGFLANLKPANISNLLSLLISLLTATDSTTNVPYIFLEMLNAFNISTEEGNYFLKNLESVQDTLREYLPNEFFLEFLNYAINLACAKKEYRPFLIHIINYLHFYAPYDSETIITATKLILKYASNDKDLLQGTLDLLNSKLTLADCAIALDLKTEEDLSPQKEFLQQSLDKYCPFSNMFSHSESITLKELETKKQLMKTMVEYIVLLENIQSSASKNQNLYFVYVDLKNIFLNFVSDLNLKKFQNDSKVVIDNLSSSITESKGWEDWADFTLKLLTCLTGIGAIVLIALEIQAQKKEKDYASNNAAVVTPQYRNRFFPRLHLLHNKEHALCIKAQKAGDRFMKASAKAGIVAHQEAECVEMPPALPLPSPL